MAKKKMPVNSPPPADEAAVSSSARPAPDREASPDSDIRLTLTGAPVLVTRAPAALPETRRHMWRRIRGGG